MAKAGRKWVRWTRRKREAFLDHLAGTCNVMASARAAEVRPVSAYALRRKDARFREEWHEALMNGYAVLETALVGHALDGGDGVRAVEGACGPVNVSLALHLLTKHRNSLNERRRHGAPPLQRATREETNAAILEKLTAYEKRLALPSPEAAPAVAPLLIEAGGNG